LEELKQGSKKSAGNFLDTRQCDSFVSWAESFGDSPRLVSQLLTPTVVDMQKQLRDMATCIDCCCCCYCCDCGSLLPQRNVLHLC